MHSEIYSKHDSKTMFATLNLVSAMMVMYIAELAMDINLISDKTSIRLTGRAAITGCKPNLILKSIEKPGIFKEPRDHVVDEGLESGAAVNTCCMNSIGVHKNPIGGIRGGGCILNKRIEYYKKSKERKP